MKFLTKTLLLSTLVLFSFIAKSQSSVGFIKILFNPSNAIILLDGDTVKNGIYPVSIGSHLVEAWAPTRQLYSKTVEVIEGKQVFVAYTLRASEEYKNAYNYYHKEAIRTGLKKTTLYIVPAAATITAGLIGMNKINDLKAELNFYEEQIKKQIHLNSISKNPQNINTIIQSYPENVALYNETLDKLNKVERNTIIATTVLGALSIYSIYYGIKIKKPEFHYEDKEPQFSYLNFGIGAQYNRNLFIVYNF